MQASSFVVLAVALAGACLLATAVADPAPARPVFDFKGKNAVNALGRQKLSRVLQKSRMTHKTVEELSKQIEDDPDLVRPRGSLLSLAFSIRLLPYII